MIGRTTRSSRARGPLLLLTLVAGLAGCDRGTAIVIVPELVVTETFEAGLGEWRARALETALGSGGSTAEASSADAFEGAQAVRFRLENPGGSGKVWIERPFELKPGQLYDIDVSFTFRSEGADAGEAWRILAGAHSEAPRSSPELTVQDATSAGSSPPLEWNAFAYSLSARADDEGLVFVTLGVWGTTPGTRAFLMDAVALRFTRAN